MQYFFDTSAAVKIYHQEVGSDRILPLYQGDEVIVISELSKVGFVSTIHKKLRMGEITAETLDAVKNRFLADSPAALSSYTSPLLLLMQPWTL